jgi:hypothetical protein
VVPDGTLEAPVAVALARLVVVGGDGRRLHEEVIAAGGVMSAGTLRRLNVGELDQALHGVTTTPVPQPMRARLADLWPKHKESLFAALRARMKDRSEQLAKTLGDRAQKEMDDAAAVLQELRDSILAELKRPQQKQLELFIARTPGGTPLTKDERDQIERNRRSLELRVEQIPKEIELERAAIAARFAEPTPQLFPVAVTYLVPRALASEAAASR